MISSNIKTIKIVSIFLLFENALFFYEINVINLSIVYETRKSRKFEITIKKFNREFIN